MWNIIIGGLCTLRTPSIYYFCLFFQCPLLVLFRNLVLTILLFKAYVFWNCLVLLTCFSKSEYVRCLRFTSEDTLYVATNHGYLYHAKLSDTGDVYWTEIIRVREEVPIVCMDLLSKPFELGCGVEDWIALGDGKGNTTVIQVMSDVYAPNVGFAFTWSAELERRLLGTHWSKSLGCR